VIINGTTEYTIDAASSQITFSYTSEGDRTIQINYTSNISGNTAPTITNPLIEDYAVEGQKYGYEFSATDPESDALTWTMQTDATFLNIISNDATGTVYGTPRLNQDEGVYYVNVIVSDGSLTDNCNYTLRVTIEKNVDSPIKVFTDTEYDPWTNKLKIELWYHQTGGSEEAKVKEKYIIVFVDGEQINGFISLNSSVYVDMPWNHFDPNQHDVRVLGYVVVDWSDGPWTYASEPEDTKANNFPRFLFLMVIFILIGSILVMLIVERLKKRRELSS
jgi:hypothetical protein